MKTRYMFLSLLCYATATTAQVRLDTCGVQHAKDSTDVSTAICN